MVKLHRLAVPLAVAALTACGGDGPADVAPSSPEGVVRAWGQALNAGDNEAAARLFTPRPILVDGAILPTLPSTFEGVVRWHARLECGGEIVGLRAEGQRVTATFALTDRPASRCPAPGYESTVIFNLEDGLIRTWEQTAPGYVPEYD